VTNSGGRDNLDVSIQLSGDAAFSIVGASSFSVAPGTSANFTVRYAPSTSGPAETQVEITHNNLSAPLPWTFALSATGDSGARLEVRGNDNLRIPSGAGAAPAFGTHWGWNDMSTPVEIEREFRIVNAGKRPLSLTTPTISGANFSLTEMPATTVAPRGSTRFKVKYTASAAGVSAATVTFASNDPDVPTYTLNLRALAGSKIWYVSPDGDDSDGLSWATAKKSLAAAVGLAAANDAILIGDGYYGLGATVSITKTLALIGASGDPASVVFNGGGTLRCFEVTGASTMISGLTVTNGFAGLGGGLYVNADHILLDNVVLSGNRSTTASGNGGGAIKVIDQPITLNNVVLRGNQSTGHGAGLYNSSGISTIVKTLFDANSTASGTYGGAAWAQGYVCYSTFTTNTAQWGGA